VLTVEDQPFGNQVLVDLCTSQRVSKVRYGRASRTTTVWQDDVCNREYVSDGLTTAACSRPRSVRQPETITSPHPHSTEPR